MKYCCIVLAIVVEGRPLCSRFGYCFGVGSVASFCIFLLSGKPPRRYNNLLLFIIVLLLWLLLCGERQLCTFILFHFSFFGYGAREWHYNLFALTAPVRFYTSWAETTGWQKTDS